MDPVQLSLAAIGMNRPPCRAWTRDPPTLTLGEKSPSLPLPAQKFTKEGKRGTAPTGRTIRRVAVPRVRSLGIYTAFDRGRAHTTDTARNCYEQTPATGCGPSGPTCWGVRGTRCRARPRRSLVATWRPARLSRPIAHATRRSTHAQSRQPRWHASQMSLQGRDQPRLSASTPKKRINRRQGENQWRK